MAYNFRNTNVMLIAKNLLDHKAGLVGHGVFESGDKVVGVSAARFPPRPRLLPGAILGSQCTEFRTNFPGRLLK